MAWPAAITAASGDEAVAPPAGGKSLRYVATARRSLSVIFDVELTTTSAISPVAPLNLLRPVLRYSAMSSLLQRPRPSRSSATRLGAVQSWIAAPCNALLLSAPNTFLAVWQAPQWPGPSTR